MVGSKWAFQFQRIVDAELVNSRVVKVINPPEQNPFPACKVVARFHQTPSEQHAQTHAGVKGGQMLFNDIAPKMRARPWLRRVEAWNEPLGFDLFNADWCQVFTDATLEFMRLCHREGWHVVAGNFSVGQPPLNAWQIFRQFVEAMQPDDWLGLHEYWVESVQRGIDEWWVCRYRMVLDKLAPLKPKIFIGECGMDGLLEGSRPKGWREYLNGNDEAYMAQLCDYEREFNQDPEVVAVAPFIWGWHPPWQSYTMEPEMSKRLHDHIEASHG